MSFEKAAESWGAQVEKEGDLGTFVPGALQELQDNPCSSMLFHWISEALEKQNVPWEALVVHTMSRALQQIHCELLRQLLPLAAGLLGSL